MARASMRRLAVSPLVAIVVAVGALALGAVPVAADHGCGHTPWPRFTEVAPTAKRIVVGTVIDRAYEPPPHIGDRGLYDPNVEFRLRIDEVLRGSAPEALIVRHLRSDVPQVDPRAECSWFHASVGDRVGRVRALSGHERDGSSLGARRGITPPTGSLADIADVGTRVVGTVVRSLGDAAARERCTTIPGSTPDLQEGTSPTVLVAAYRMRAPDVDAFAERLGGPGEGLRRIAETRPDGLDVCVFDGRFTPAELPRALVALTVDAPPWVTFAQCHPSDIPLDVERAAPLSRPRHYISRC